MTDGAGPSQPKRERSESCDVHDFEVKIELFTDDESGDEFIPGRAIKDCSSKDHNHKQVTCSRVSTINSSVPRLHATSPQSMLDISIRQQNLSHNLSSFGPLAEDSTSTWSVLGEMRNLPFKRFNEFYTSLGTNPIDYFDYFFSEEFLIMICEETNKHAEKLSTEETQILRITQWKELTVSELRVFLGLLFHMGTIQLSRIQDYWKTDRLFSIPIFTEQMDRNRFLLIMKCLHFTSENNSDDPVHKVRSVIDYFNTKMNDCYYPSRELSIDVGMILWRGQLGFCHFIKNKRHKYQIKLYMLNEPDGLILKLCVYTGGHNNVISGKVHVRNVVMKLLEEKLRNGHAVYMCNFYNSYELTKQLLDYDTYCTGTLRNNLKQNPHDVVQKELKKGENISRFCEGVHIGKWKGKRPVTYITTEFEDKMVSVTNRLGQVTQKPKAIAKYNQIMTATDWQDQLLTFYPYERKTLRWYLKVAIHTFQLLFINSFKIYNKYSGQPNMSLYDYRLSVIGALLPKKHVTRNPSLVQNDIVVRHKIKKITDRNAIGKLKRKQCRQCTKEKKRTDTIWHCVTCSEKPGLCVECFDVYHSVYYRMYNHNHT